MDSPGSADIVILGGGICGLPAAWQLARAGKRVVLLERDNQTGGLIKTHREGDWIFETGPGSIVFSRNDDIHQFLRDLDLDDELLVKPLRVEDNFIWRSGLLRRVPGQVSQLTRKNAVSRRVLTRALPGLWRRYQLPAHDVSVGAFFSPLIGRQAVEQLLAPALAGIYASHPFSLSLQATLPRVYQALKKNNRLWDALRVLRNTPGGSGRMFHPAGNGLMASFKGGMQTLADRITREAQSAGAEILTKFDAKKLERQSDGEWTITSAEGSRVSARQIVCALPAHGAAGILETECPETTSLLRELRCVPLVVAHVGTRQADVGVELDGMGHLSGRDSGARALGMLWNDKCFEGRAPADHRLFTVYIGGLIDPLACDLAATEPLELAFSDLKLVMKWKGSAAVASRLTYHKNAIPLLEVGHLARVQKVRESLPDGLYLAGNYLNGVSLPACIRGTRQVVKDILEPQGK